MSEIDPAAIMADHAGEHRCEWAHWSGPRQCLPYRLAADIDRLRAAEQRVRALVAKDFSDRCARNCGSCGDTCDAEGMKLYLYPVQVRAALDGQP